MMINLDFKAKENKIILKNLAYLILNLLSSYPWANVNIMTQK